MGGGGGSTHNIRGGVHLASGGGGVYINVKVKII